MTETTSAEIVLPLTKVKGKYQVTIPTEVRKAVGLAVGDLLEATAHGTKIVLTPKVVVHREIVEAAISQGLADAKKGRIRGPFKNMAAFRKSLRRT